MLNLQLLPKLAVAVVLLIGCVQSVEAGPANFLLRRLGFAWSDGYHTDSQSSIPAPPYAVDQPSFPYGRPMQAAPVDGDSGRPSLLNPSLLNPSLLNPSEIEKIKQDLEKNPKPTKPQPLPPKRDDLQQELEDELKSVLIRPGTQHHSPAFQAYRQPLDPSYFQPSYQQPSYQPQPQSYGPQYRGAQPPPTQSGYAAPPNYELMPANPW